MSCPRRVGLRASIKAVTNRVTGPLAPWLPGFGVVEHIGRKSGQRFRTPVNVFPRAGGCAIALTYGSDSQWVRNVLAHGGCALETRGHTWQLTQPRAATAMSADAPCRRLYSSYCACCMSPSFSISQSTIARGARPQRQRQMRHDHHDARSVGRDAVCPMNDALQAA